MIEVIQHLPAPEGFSENILEVALNKLIGEEGFLEGDLIFVLMDDESLLEYNKELLDHNYYTDIITIDQKIVDVISAELLISVDRIKENAEQLNEPFLKELYRVMFHGVLHVIGYNDKSEEEQKIMRERENFYLSSLTF